MAVLRAVEADAALHAMLVMVEGVEPGPCTQLEDFLRVCGLQAVLGLLQ
ncbi:MAG: hypothetical protein ACYDBH_00005 [Acidobacteriaceae bacterium]